MTRDIKRSGAIELSGFECQVSRIVEVISLRKGSFHVLDEESVCFLDTSMGRFGRDIVFVFNMVLHCFGITLSTFLPWL